MGFKRCPPIVGAASSMIDVKLCQLSTHVVDLSSSTPRIPGISAVGSGISKRESLGALWGV